MYIHEYLGHTIYVACKNDGNGEAPVIQISWSKLDVKRHNIYMSDAPRIVHTMFGDCTTGVRIGVCLVLHHELDWTMEGKLTAKTFVKGG
jgi:hypothetical protein